MFSTNPTVRSIILLSIFGVLTIVLGYIVNLFLSPLFKISLPDVCQNWNKNYIMEMSLFFTGILLTLVVMLFCGYIHTGFTDNIISKYMI